MSEWWRLYPQKSRRCYGSTPLSHPDPRLVAGTLVRLVGKPAQVRRVIKSEWHSHQRVYVYIIETTAPTPFEPYWFAEQLEVVE